MNEYEVGYDAARKLVAQEVLDMIDRYTNRAAITEIKKLMARHIKEANDQGEARPHEQPERKDNE